MLFNGNGSTATLGRSAFRPTISANPCPALVWRLAGTGRAYLASCSGRSYFGPHTTRSKDRPVLISVVGTKGPFSWFWGWYFFFGLALKIHWLVWEVHATS